MDTAYDVYDQLSNHTMFGKDQNIVIRPKFNIHQLATLFSTSQTHH